MQENQPNDNAPTNEAEIAIKLAESVRNTDKVKLQNEVDSSPVPIRNDRPVNYELKVICEDGFSCVLQKGALNKIVKEGALEDRVRKYRDALEFHAKVEENIKNKKVNINANTGRSSI